jgi:arginine decarboxylase
MNIDLVAATASGPTELAAFDAALLVTGLANYNLIYLSSVIPPGAVLRHAETTDPGGSWGDRLYVVAAQHRTSTPGEQVWAGIGWVQNGSTGAGLFVEHHGNHEDTVRNDIELSLKALMQGRNIDFGQIHVRITGGTCLSQPLCALVAAAYESRPWRT